jgi:hypothetical protein
MAKRLSLLEKIAHMQSTLEKSDAEFNDHLLIMVEVDDAGKPVGTALKTQATPYALLGMIDMAVHRLEKARVQIKEKFESMDEVSRIVAKLPGDLGEKIYALEKRMRDASERGDEIEMKAIHRELDDLLNTNKSDVTDLLRSMRNNDDDDQPKKDSGDDFNISDFLKGGL